MKTFVIPPFLSHLPTHNGLPIPPTAFIAENGVPDFRVTDITKWERVTSKRLCGICGKPLGETIAFIGGEKSIASGFFFDPAMHEECAEFSAKVCPFIAMGKSYSARSLPKGATEIAGIPAVQAARMGILRCSGYQRVKFENESNIYLQATGIKSVTWITEKESA